MVILNNHVSKSMWPLIYMGSVGWELRCCSLSDGEGLWYTKEYPEELWLEAIGRFAFAELISH